MPRACCDGELAQLTVQALALASGAANQLKTKSDDTVMHRHNTITVTISADVHGLHAIASPRGSSGARISLSGDGLARSSKACPSRDEKM